MAGAFDIKILWTVVKDTFTYLSGKASEKKTNIIEAHKATNAAFIQTYDYLRNQKGTYVPKTDLANVWNEASAAVMQVDENLGLMLYNKSRFWLDPDLYINLGREEEIIELDDIVSEMERLRMKL
jgi:hypothetical protein